MLQWTLTTPVIAEWTSEKGDLYRIHSAPQIQNLGAGLTGTPLWAVQLFFTKNNERVIDEAFRSVEDAVDAIRKLAPDAPDIGDFRLQW